MREKDDLRLSTLRLLSAALHNKALEKRARLVKSGGAADNATLTEEEAMAVVQGEAKRRKDAAGEYEKGARPELAAKEILELAILETYLPPEASDEAIETAVAEVITETGKDQKQFGKIMGLVTKKLAGRASGDRIAEVVKKIISEA